METIKNTIGNNIRMLRKQRGQTLDSLSRQIGITHQQLSRIEKGGGYGNKIFQGTETES